MLSALKLSSTEATVKDSHFTTAHQDIVLRSLLDSVTNAIILTDNTGKITYVNRKGKQDIFHDFHSFHDKSLAQVINFMQIKYRTQNFKQLFDLIHKTIDPESFVSDTVQIQIHKTTDKVYEVFTAPIYDSYCGHLGRIWQFNDITKQQKLDEIKSEFISLASHQLRTPISSIRGYLDMINHGDYGEVPAALLEPLQALTHTSEEMADLVEDLLKISRLERTENNAHQRLELDKLIQQVLAELNSLALERNITLRFVDESPAHTISTDQTKLTECLTNLVQNAIKYSHVGGNVVVNLKKTDSYFEIVVQDHGIGIPIDQQDKVFEKFFRGSNAAQSTEGTGLGLYYVKKAINDLGGKVSFRSLPNLGTTFLLNLPA